MSFESTFKRTVDIKLEEALFNVVTGINNPANHYMINANYYDSGGEKVYLAAIYLHKDSSWNLALGPDSITCEVLLNRSNLDNRYLISLPYTEIWKISQKQESSIFTETDKIFYDPVVLSRLSKR